MSNLLPQLEKRAVWAQYRARFLIAGSLVAFVAALLAFTALLPSYLALRADRGAGSPPVATSTASVQSDAQGISHAAALLQVLSPLVSATTTPTQAIAEALGKRPSGIGIDHIDFTSGLPDTIVLTGSAGTIDEINAYAKALQSDALFSAVSVPVGDLAGAANGQFTVTLSGTF